MQEGKEERKIDRERNGKLELKGRKTGNKKIHKKFICIICQEFGWNATAAVIRLAERVC